MEYPTIPSRNVTRDMTDVFRGLDRNLRSDEGSWRDMTNMTMDLYPVFASRKKRAVFAEPVNAQGIINKDALCWVDGSQFVINGNPVEMGLSDAEEDCPKKLISMGAYVVILPDKKWINTLDLTDFGNIEAKFVSTEDVTFSLSTIDGAEYGDYVISSTAPEEPVNLQYWLDTSGEKHALKQYSEASGIWVTVPATYIRIHSIGIGKAFEQYDGVDISGVISDELQDLNASMVVWSKGDDYLVVSGILDRAISQEAAAGAVTVKRQMPKLDCVTEAGNRLWGCRYGPAVNGEIVNEIYCSKLGDFKNWNCFMGLSTDSWVGGVGTDGQWTGAATLSGYPVFFKENHLHKVYISPEGAHQIVDTACRGVQKGCENSLAIVNEVLYYLSRSGVCAYDGSLPQEVSQSLGQTAYRNGVAGAWWNKYVISMQEPAGSWNLYVYDVSKGLWSREDNLHAAALCECDGDLFAIDADSGNILSLGGNGSQEESVEWSAETGDLLLSMPDQKYVSWLAVRMRLEAGHSAVMYAKYDEDPYWIRLFPIKGAGLKSFSVPIRPRRCDRMRLKIEGSGEVRIYSITKTIEKGSEIP